MRAESSTTRTEIGSGIRALPSGVLAIEGRPIGLDEFEFGVHAEERFGMPDEKEGFGRHGLPEPLDRRLLRGLVEVYQDIAAKDYVEAAQPRVVLEVVIVEAHGFLDLFLELVAAGLLVEVLGQVALGNALDARIRVEGFLAHHQAF